MDVFPRLINTRHYKGTCNNYRVEYLTTPLEGEGIF